MQISGEYVVPCDLSKYDTLSLLIGGYWFEIKPETYIIKVNLLYYHSLLIDQFQHLHSWDCLFI